MRGAAPCREGVGKQLERLYHHLRCPYTGGCYRRGTGNRPHAFHLKVTTSPDGALGASPARPPHPAGGNSGSGRGGTCP